MMMMMMTMLRIPHNRTQQIKKKVRGCFLTKITNQQQKQQRNKRREKNLKLNNFTKIVYLMGEFVMVG